MWLPSPRSCLSPRGDKTWPMKDVAWRRMGTLEQRRQWNTAHIYIAWGIAAILEREHPWAGAPKCNFVCLFFDLNSVLDLFHPIGTFPNSGYELSRALNVFTGCLYICVSNFFRKFVWFSSAAFFGFLLRITVTISPDVTFAQETQWLVNLGLSTNN